MPCLVDLVTLRLRQTGKGAARRQIGSLENNYRDVIMPSQMLLWRKETIFVKVLRIIPGRIKAGGYGCIAPFHFFMG
jgi:hypothetical protein